MTSLVLIRGRQIERFRKRAFGKVLQRVEKREGHRRLLKRLVDGPPEKLDDLLVYLDENWAGIFLKKVPPTLDKRRGLIL